VIDFGLVDEAVGKSTHVVTLRGEIDALTAPRLGSRLFGLAEDGAKGVVVDLSHVTFMDSTGIGVLVNSLRHLGLRRCKMVLVCPTERILRPFQVTGLMGHLTIFDSREKALGCFAQ
jgi:anti-sigma B factor antagonist